MRLAWRLFIMHGLKERVIDEVLESRPNALDWSSDVEGNADSDLRNMISL